MEFNELDLKQLDKDLSEEQRAEWNILYASYRSKSLLHGTVTGVDRISVPGGSGEGANCLIVIPYRVKVLIPEAEAWYDEESKRPEHVLRAMMNAHIDFVITHVDREGEWCLASRRQALMIQRRSFLRLTPEVGRKVQANILVVGRTHLLAECCGYDITLSQRDLSYAMISNLKDRYKPGETRTAVIKGYDKEKDRLAISIKEAEPHPFDGADQRHPIGCRCASVITGKYAGGVFCKLEPNLDCLCTYSAQQYDNNFDIGDEVIVVVTKYNYPKKQIYGKIVAKY